MLGSKDAMEAFLYALTAFILSLFLKTSNQRSPSPLTKMLRCLCRILGTGCRHAQSGSHGPPGTQSTSYS